MCPQQHVVADYQTAGLSLRDRPLRFLRAELQGQGIITAAELATVEPDRKDRVAGLVLLRQRLSTVKGITIMTLEDETGTANLVVHRATWERFHTVARRAGVLIARGLLERQDRVIHLVVDQWTDQSSRIADTGTRSRGLW